MNPKSYVRNAVRTKSDGFYSVLVPPSIFQVAIIEAMTIGNLVDAIKKALFYGKPYSAPQRLINAAASLPEPIRAKGFSFNAVPVDVQHAILGVFTEGAELVEALGISAVDGEPLDLVNLDEEFGDILWYVAVYCDHRGISIEDLMAKNIAKLRARFPDRFSTEKAIHRNLDAERKELEQNQDSN